MKVVLFAMNASFVHTNLAVRCLRGPLEKAGFDVVILEKNGKERRDSVLAALIGENAGIYCFSAYLWNITELLSLASQVRLLLPEARIVFGGPEVSFEDESFFAAHPYVDHIVTGEGENVLPLLCADPERFPRIVRGKPFAAFEMENGILYRAEDDIGGSFLYYESSRGCPFRCAYCLSGNAGPVRFKSAEQTLAELASFRSLGKEIRVIKFVDRTFNADRKRAYDIWNGIPKDFPFRCHFEICAALLDDRTLELLRGIGPDRFQFEIGVQSTHPETRKAICRTDDLDACLFRMKQLKDETKIPVHADLIAGLPYEGMTELKNSFDTVFPLCDVLQLGFLKVLKGSLLRSKAEVYGLIWSPDPPYTVLSTPWLSFRELSELKRMADVLDRFSNSGCFSRGLSSVLPLLPSPFDFFFGLSCRLGESFYRLSQRSAYGVLLGYLSELTCFTDETAVSLASDFLLCETGRLPECFRPYLVPAAKEEKDRLFAESALTERFDYKTTEVYRARDGYLAADRKNRLWLTVPLSI